MLRILAASPLFYHFLYDFVLYYSILLYLLFLFDFIATCRPVYFIPSFIEYVEVCSYLFVYILFSVFTG